MAVDHEESLSDEEYRAWHATNHVTVYFLSCSLCSRLVRVRDAMFHPGPGPAALQAMLEKAGVSWE